MKEHKITTHILGDGWFTAELDGIPLIGKNGGYSRFRSRKEAREAAEYRLIDQSSCKLEKPQSKGRD